MNVPDGYYIYGDQSGIYGNMSRATARIEAKKIKIIDHRFNPKVIKARGTGFNLYVLHPFRW
jgi:hypothetical protein